MTASEEAVRVPARKSVVFPYSDRVRHPERNPMLGVKVPLSQRCYAALSELGEGADGQSVADYLLEQLTEDDLKKFAHQYIADYVNGSLRALIRNELLNSDVLDRPQQIPFPSTPEGSRVPNLPPQTFDSPKRKAYDLSLKLSFPVTYFRGQVRVSKPLGDFTATDVMNYASWLRGRAATLESNARKWERVASRLDGDKTLRDLPGDALDVLFSEDDNE